MELSDALRQRILNLLTEKNLTVSKLSTLAGISRSTLSKFLSKKRKYIHIEVIEFICEGLNMKLKDFFDDSLFDNIFISDDNTLQ